MKVGDTITLAVLGREIDAKVAVLRKVDFAGFGASFPIVVDPAALAGAQPRRRGHRQGHAAGGTPRHPRPGRAVPQVNVISVREQLEAAADLFDRLALAIRGAAAVAALAGLLVLAGAIAAGRRRGPRRPRP